eukprot:768387-Hanusia_phi.AAC.4
MLQLLLELDQIRRQGDEQEPPVPGRQGFQARRGNKRSHQQQEEGQVQKEESGIGEWDHGWGSGEKEGGQG